MAGRPARLDRPADVFVTFVGGSASRWVHAGIGTSGVTLAARDGPAVSGFTAASAIPVVWVWATTLTGVHIERLQLADLETEAVPWRGARLGALACSPTADEAVALVLPAEVSGDPPHLERWDGKTWGRVETQPAPDISSQLAWLDHRRVVFESVHRRLTVVDLEDETTESGPPGRHPTVAPARGVWYAIVGENVVRFDVDQPLSRGGVPDCTWAVSSPSTIHVTADAHICTWREMTWPKQVKAYIQERGGRRSAVPELVEGVGAVLGPYDL